MEQRKRQRNDSNETHHPRAFGSGPGVPTIPPLSKANRFGRNMSMAQLRTARTDERGSKVNSPAMLRRQR